MGFWELLLIALGLSMDAFAVAICTGLGLRKITIGRAAAVGGYFGAFQAAMPLIGYLIASRFADKIVAYDHWIAFILLAIIGGKMLKESFEQKGCSDRKCPAKPACADRECPGEEEKCADRECPPAVCADRECPGGERTSAEEPSLGPGRMLPLAVATSIDALAVGVSFAFLQVEIAPAVGLIGVTTFVLSMVGVKIGNLFGVRFQSKAEFAGGVILILMGVKILLEHLGILQF